MDTLTTPDIIPFSINLSDDSNFKIFIKDVKIEIITYFFLILMQENKSILLEGPKLIRAGLFVITHDEMSKLFFTVLDLKNIIHSLKSICISENLCLFRSLEGFKSLQTLDASFLLEKLPPFPNYPLLEKIVAIQTEVDALTFESISKLENLRVLIIGSCPFDALNHVTNLKKLQVFGLVDRWAVSIETHNYFEMQRRTAAFIQQACPSVKSLVFPNLIVNPSGDRQLQDSFDDINFSYWIGSQCQNFFCNEPVGSWIVRNAFVGGLEVLIKRNGDMTKGISDIFVMNIGDGMSKEVLFEFLDEKFLIRPQFNLVLKKMEPSDELYYVKSLLSKHEMFSWVVVKTEGNEETYVVINDEIGMLKAKVGKEIAEEDLFLYFPKEQNKSLDDLQRHFNWL